MRRGGVIGGGGARGCGDEERALGRHGGGGDVGLVRQRQRHRRRRIWAGAGEVKGGGGGAEDFLGVESFLVCGVQGLGQQ